MAAAIEMTAPVFSIEEARRRGLLGKSKRAKKPDPPASYTPHRAVILGVDPAKRSGWGVLESPGRLGELARYVDSGESGDEEQWIRAIRCARFAEQRHQTPLVVIMETWTTGGRADGRMRAATLVGLGESRGRWRALLNDAGHPRRRIVSVNTMTWRAALLGAPMNRTTAEWKSAARQFVYWRFGKEVGPDEAEGLCIAMWGVHAGRVGALLPKRR